MGRFKLVMKRLFYFYSTKGGTFTGVLVTFLLGTVWMLESMFFWVLRIFFPESEYNLDNFLNIIGLPVIVVVCSILILMGILYDGIPPEELNNTLKTSNYDNNLRLIWKSMVDKLSNQTILLVVIFYFIGLIIFTVGQGIHSATNFLNFRAVEHSIDLVFPEYYQHVWFLDEVVGHWFAYTGFWIIMFLLGFMNLNIPSFRALDDSRWFLLPMIALILGGGVWVLFAFEGEYAIWGMGIAIFNLIYFGRGLYKRRNYPAYSKSQYPVVWFSILFFFLFTNWISTLSGFYRRKIYSTL
jgi:hypothetical protein